MSRKLDLVAFLVVATTIGFFSLIWLSFFFKPPDESNGILNVLIGSVGTSWTGIVMYYFGSSSGSAKKTDMMGAPTTQTTTTPEKVVTVTTPTPKPDDPQP
jgi:hypothetical protein